MAAKPGSVSNAKALDDGGKFTLDTSDLENLTGTRGRKPVDSVYLAEVENAMKNPTIFKKGELLQGDIHAIKVTETRKAAWIGPQLRKAAKQLGVDTKAFTVLDRTGSARPNAPLGFVAYWVKDLATDSESE